MDPATKKILDELKSTIEEFKNANDNRLKALEKTGKEDVVLVTKVDAINASITEMQAKLEDALATAKAAEAAANRKPVNGNDPEAVREEAKNVRLFMAMTRRKPLEEIEVTDTDTTAYRAYRNAFNQMMRNGGRGADSLTPELRNALQVGSDPAGGYWVTPDMSGRIISLIYETSPMRQYASVQSIGTGALEGANDLDEAGAGWVGETEARTETTTPALAEYRIPVFEQYANPKASQTLLDDANVDVEAWLNGKVSAKFTRLENTAFFTGTGVKKPRGFLTYAAGTPSATTWSVIERVLTGADGGFLNASPGDCLINLVFALKEGYRQGANFFANRLTLAALRKLKDGQGNYLITRDFTDFAKQIMLGFPVAEAADMPTIAVDSLSLAFGNFKEAYQIVDRQGIKVLRDPYTAKPWVQFYTTRRVGGDVVNFDAIKLLQFGN